MFNRKNLAGPLAKALKARSSVDSTPGGIAFSSENLLTHDIGKDRKFRTKVHRKTLNPMFNEAFVAHGVLGKLIAGPLVAKVLDSDALSTDDILGTLELSLSPLATEDSVEWARTRLAGAKHGTLSLHVWWEASEESLDSGRSAMRLDQQGTLSVHVIEALDLVAADSSGASDPYVKVKLMGVPKGNMLQIGGGKVVDTLSDIGRKVTSASISAQETLSDAQSLVRSIGKGTLEVPMELVEAPTPDELWFTPRDGWNAAKEAHTRLDSSGQLDYWSMYPRTSGPRSTTASRADVLQAVAAGASSTSAQQQRMRELHQLSLKEWTPPPPRLVPHHGEAPELYHDPQLFETSKDTTVPPPLGELYVEVLQAEGLADGGLLDEADPYAVLVVEGNAARTCTVRNCRSPRWPFDAPRAFRFPLRRPYGCLYIGLMDDDQDGTLARTGIDDDDPLGRVVVPLGRLSSNTVYDNWYFVQYENSLRHAGSRGALRLRISVRYASERARLLAYVRPFPDMQPPGQSGRGASAVVPFSAKAPWKNAQLAVHGKEPTGYDADELKAYLVEITRVLGGALTGLLGVKRLLFWQISVPLSVVLLVSWQVLVSYPSLVPAAMCFGMAAVLQRSLLIYGGRDDSAEGEAATAISAQPGLVALLAALLFDRSPAPPSVHHRGRERERDPAHSSASHRPAEPDAKPEGSWLYDSNHGSGSDSEDGDAGAKAKAKAKAEPDDANAAAAAAAKKKKEKKKKKKNQSFMQVLGMDDEPGGGLLDSPLLGGAGGGALATERVRMKKEVLQQDIEEDQQASIQEQKPASIPSDSLNPFEHLGNAAAVLNPLAGVLGAVQPVVRDLLCLLRSAQRTLMWTDRRLTLWLWLGLISMGALLAVAALLVPWEIVWMCVGRLVGLLLLGPHMIWVGRWVDKRQAATAAKEAAYAQADKAGRLALLAEVQDEVVAEDAAEDEMEKAELEKRPVWIKAKQNFLRGNKYNMMMHIPYAPSEKFVGVPLAFWPSGEARSRAWPVPRQGAAALVAPSKGGDNQPSPSGSAGASRAASNALAKPPTLPKPRPMTGKAHVDRAQRSKETALL